MPAANRNSTALKRTRQVLCTTGLKATTSRATILEIIRQGKGHLDADEIHHRARLKVPHLSLSTVYRNLQKFKELDLIEELHFDENHHHYEVKPAAEHHHLKCLCCGDVIEFDYPLSRYITKNVDEARNFQITKSEVHLSGYCPNCRPKRNKDNSR